MKKVLALVLAVVLCMSMSAVAFAADIINTKGTEEIELTVKVANGEDFYEADDLNASISWNDGKEYFKSVELDDGDGADEIDVTVKFKDYYGTDDIDVDFDLSLKKGSSKKEITYTPGEGETVSADNKSINIVKTFGWGTIDTEEVDDDDASINIKSDDGEVIFDDDTVKFATFEFDNCDALSVAGKMSKQDAVNMYLDVAVNDDIKAIMKKNEDVDFDVVNFKGAPEFDFTQEVTYYIDDEDVTYYVYEIVNGKAVEVAAKLNDDKDAMVWKTRVLGTYIVTDDKIEATAAADDTTDADKENPETGAVDFVNVAVALGAVSLVAAGAVALKK
ncbi:MAG: hypothetical protein PHD67_05335 [Oscillospiraceae bacterium]|nr:hypothetical protein [Oscillospiraceae bacterium]